MHAVYKSQYINSILCISSTRKYFVVSPFSRVLLVRAQTFTVWCDIRTRMPNFWPFARWLYRTQNIYVRCVLPLHNFCSFWQDSYTHTRAFCKPYMTFTLVPGNSASYVTLLHHTRGTCSQYLYLQGTSVSLVGFRYPYHSDFCQFWKISYPYPESPKPAAPKLG